MITLTTFLAILTICAAVTSVLTTWVKKALDKIGVTYISNIVVLVDAVLVAIGVSIYYYNTHDINFSALNIFLIVCMAIANWCGAMYGYDKVRQTIKQLVTYKDSIVDSITAESAENEENTSSDNTDSNK